MKTKLLLTAALIVTASSITRAQAADAVLPPRVAQQQHELRKVPGTTPNVLNRSVPIASPRGLAFQESIRTVPGKSVDLIVRSVLPASPRVIANEPWRLQQVQVAPLR